MFAIGKIVGPSTGAARNWGTQRVQLAAGTWHFDFLPAADLFLPRHVKLIGLDYGVLRRQARNSATAERGKCWPQVGAHRQVIPVIWAQHDDGNYIGRPYTPFAEFHAKLADAKAGGFGIIHWTTRPLDLFFASHAKQVWRSTKDQPLRATCDDDGGKILRRGGPQTMGEYLGTLGDRRAASSAGKPATFHRPAS